MSYGFNTIAIHGGPGNDPVTGAVSLPIYQTSTFEQDAPGKDRGYCYARTGNPTRSGLEQALAALEGAAHGLAFASGLSAVNAVLNLLSAGDHVIACRDLYGGSYRIFTKLYAKFGVDFAFVDTTDLAAVRQAFTPRTKLLWLETPSNPLLSISDIAACAALARQRGALSVVDNTFATPVAQKPLELGADIVLHSTTKYLNGHGDVLGGAVVTNSNDLADQIRYFQNAVGAVPGPQDCFLVLRGLKTLGLRFERHCHNAQAVAEFLSVHDKVARVYYPGLKSHPGHEIARGQQRLFGGIVSFELRAEADEARRFTKYPLLFTLAESLGSVKSLLCHPPTMTHAAVEPDVRRECGISDGLIRLSVGIEDADDLIADLEQALSRVRVAQEAGR